MSPNMRFLNYLFISSVFFVDALAQNDGPTTIYLSDESPVTWSPTESETVAVSADSGYLIKVNITKCDLNGENNEFATIKDGADETDTTKSLIFSYVLNQNYSFIYNNNELKAEFSGSPPSVFTAVFTRLGEAPSTDEPTTEIYLPTASVNDSTSLTVFLYGSRPEEFGNGTVLEKEFRAAVAGMAVEYCATENIFLNQSITIDNVIFDDIDLCPLAWHESLCARIIFRVPVSQDPDAQSQWTGYQLNSRHLSIMWDRLFGKYIAPLGLAEDSGPNFESMITWRIVVFCIVLVLFIALLLGLKAIMTRLVQRSNRSSLSDTKSIISKDRHSQTSMDPHYLQETPPLFESSFSMYNPERDSAIYTDSSYSNYADYGTGVTSGVRVISQIDDAEEIGETES